MNPFTRRYSRLGAFCLGLAGLLIVCTAAEAATVTYSGTNPTKNTDDSTIPATGAGSLTSLRIEYGTCSAPGVFGTKVDEVTRTSPAAGANFTGSLNLQPGTSCLRIFVKNTYGVESDPSNVAVRVVEPPKPMPPSLATTAPQVYDVKPNEQTFAFDRGRQVGTVKLGAACDELRTTGSDFYALERPSQVKLNRAPRSTALVARCAEKAAAARADVGQSDVHQHDGGGVQLGAGLHQTEI
jgi:hypothetical protein